MPPRKSNIQTEQPLISSFNREFAKLYSLWCSLINACTSDSVYKRFTGPGDGFPLPSIGETVLRSAAVVEQTCGGICASLWDDPFEWTLPETLSTRESILAYLGEVETTRTRAFGSFASDADLLKQISLPSGEMQTLASLLLQTLTRASQFHGQAVLTAKMLSVRNTSGFII